MVCQLCLNTDVLKIVSDITPLLKTLQWLPFSLIVKAVLTVALGTPLT